MKQMILLSTLILSGCASTLPATELTYANYGVRPMNTGRQIQEKFSKTLKDPVSAKIRVTETYKAYIRGGFGLGDENIFGWGIDVKVNAKNSFGGYTGEKTYRCLFHEDKISCDEIVGDFSPIHAANN